MINAFKPAKRSPAWKRNQRVLLFSLLTIFVVLGILIVGVYGFSEWKARRLDAYLRAQGIPVTVEEYIQSRPKIPKDENAASLYEQAFGEIRHAEWTYTEGLQRQIDATPLSVALSDDLLELIDAYLAEHATILTMMHQATQYPACDFGLPPVRIALPFQMTLGLGTGLLTMEAVSAAEKGDTQKTVDALSAAFRTGQSIQNVPHFSAQIERIHLHRMALQALQRVLSQISLSEAQLLQLQTTLQTLNDPDLLRNALIGERILLINDFGASGQLIRKNKNRIDQDILKYIPGEIDTLVYTANLSGWNRLDRVWLMQVMNDLIDVARLPYPALLDAKDAIRKKAWQKSKFPPRISYVLISTLARDITLFASDTAFLRLGETTLALERYRLANGRLPQQLSDLVPVFIDSVPVDPFDGAPLRYRLTEKGYSVYSIYRNREDDGGIPATPNREDFEGDFVFQVERKEQTSP